MVYSQYHSASFVVQLVPVLSVPSIATRLPMIQSIVAIFVTFFNPIEIQDSSFRGPLKFSDGRRTRYVVQDLDASIP